MGTMTVPLRNHQNHLIDESYKNLKENHFTDLVFILNGNERVEAHSAVLKRFLRLIDKIMESRKNCEDSEKHTISLPSQAETLKNLLQFMYTGKVRLPTRGSCVEFENVSQLLGIHDVNITKTIETNGFNLASIKVPVIPEEEKNTMHDSGLLNSSNFTNNIVKSSTPISNRENVRKDKFENSINSEIYKDKLNTSTTKENGCEIESTTESQNDNNQICDQMESDVEDMDMITDDEFESSESCGNIEEDNHMPENGVPEDFQNDLGIQNHPDMDQEDDQDHNYKVQNEIEAPQVTDDDLPHNISKEIIERRNDTNYIKCYHCNEYFKTSSELKHHLIFNHFLNHFEEEYSSKYCDECGLNFNTVEGCFLHFGISHNAVRDLVPETYYQIARNFNIQYEVKDFEIVVKNHAKLSKEFFETNTFGLSNEDKFLLTNIWENRINEAQKNINEDAEMNDTEVTQTNKKDDDTQSRRRSSWFSFGPKTLKCFCDEDKTYSFNNIKRHFVRSHFHSKIIQHYRSGDRTCPTCSKTFINLGHFIEHICVFHNKVLHYVDEDVLANINEYLMKHRSIKYSVIQNCFIDGETETIKTNIEDYLNSFKTKKKKSVQSKLNDIEATKTDDKNESKLNDVEVSKNDLINENNLNDTEVTQTDPKHDDTSSRQRVFRFAYGPKTLKCFCNEDETYTFGNMKKHFLISHYYRTLSEHYRNSKRTCPTCSRTFKENPPFIRHMGVYHNKVLHYVDEDVLANINEYLMTHRNIKYSLSQSCFVEGETGTVKTNIEDSLNSFSTKKCANSKLNDIEVTRTDDENNLNDTEVTKNDYKDDDTENRQGVSRFTYGPKTLKCFCNKDVTYTFGNMKIHIFTSHYYHKMAEHYKNGNRTCPTCSKTFPDKGHFLRHIGVSHNKVLHYLNEDFLADINEYLMTHRNIKYSVSQSCFVDGETGTVKTDIVNYLKSFTKKEQKRIKRELNDTKVTKNDHNNDTHSTSRWLNFGPKTLKCFCSNDETYTFSNMKRHFMRSHYYHLIAEPYRNIHNICPTCSKAFKSIGHLVEHIGIFHNKVLHYVDEDVLANINEYLMKYRGIKYSVSQSCFVDGETGTVNVNSRFLFSKKSKKQYKGHKNTYLPCFSCDKSFNILWEMKKHLVSVHFSDEFKSEFKHQRCDQCNKDFKNSKRCFMHYALKHKIIYDLLPPEFVEKMKKLGPAKKSVGSRNKIKKPLQHNIEKIQCSYCERQFSGARKFMDHQTKVHFKYRFFQKYSDDFRLNSGQCHLCQFKSSDSIDYYVHIGVTHRKLFEFLPEDDAQNLISFQKKTGRIIYQQNMKELSDLTQKNHQDQNERSTEKSVIDPIQNDSEMIENISQYSLEKEDIEQKFSEQSIVTLNNHLKCNYCNLQIQGTSRFLRHQIRTHFKDQFKVKYMTSFQSHLGQCQFCIYIAKTFDDYTLHMGCTHKKVLEMLPPEILEGLKLDVNERLDQFQNLELTKTGMQIVTRKQYAFTCSCDKKVIYPTYGTFKKHLYRKHLKADIRLDYGELVDTCPICAATFSQYKKGTVLEHIGIIHDKVFDYCGDDIVNQLKGEGIQVSEPKNPERRYKKFTKHENVYVEAIRGFEVDFNIEYKARKRQPVEDAIDDNDDDKQAPFCCFCDKKVTFHSYANFKKHLFRSHFRTKIRYEYGTYTKECPLCDATFKSNYHLLDHIAITHDKVIDYCSDEILSQIRAQNIQIPDSYKDKRNFSEFVKMESRKASEHEDTNLIRNKSVKEEDTEFMGWSEKQDQQHFGKFFRENEDYDNKQYAFKCYCSSKSTFVTYKGFKLHLYKSHMNGIIRSEYARYVDTCPFCKTKFREVNNLVEHIGMVHEKVLDYCDDEILNQIRAENIPIPGSQNDEEKQSELEKFLKVEISTTNEEQIKKEIKCEDEDTISEFMETEDTSGEIEEEEEPDELININDVDPQGSYNFSNAMISERTQEDGNDALETEQNVEQTSSYSTENLIWKKMEIDVANANEIKSYAKDNIKTDDED